MSPSLPPRCLSTQCTSQPWASCLLDFLPAEVLDAPTCVAYRQLQFLQAIAPPNGALQDVCQSLSHRYRLSNLYCCDSQICRVDNLVGSGRHPNVNWRTTPCQE
ncbi:hypothetical protein G6O67_002786 [Ophiocordyceps sinensis]|uniref:Uncharacterized protein n=1 Tax=Ophiocordyceps sinensis TaxID=72228 RepID=A0A8H4PUV6_9HYPO|nr:hypothetical protein G6O67_002786 [Ophiocordyceps sinensis]